MHLQDGARALGGHRAGDDRLDCLGLCQTVGHHQNLAGLHDGLDAHGVGLLGHQILVAVEEALVGLDGGRGQIHAVGLQLKGLARLVEADVAVGAKTQQLQVDAAHAVDDLVVLFAGIRSIGVGAVGQMDGLGADVDLVKQVLVHKAPIAFGMLLGQAAVLVQIDGGDLREIQVALVVPVHQLSVCANRGAAGRQTQHAVGLHNDLCGDDVGSLAGHVLVIFCTNDLHNGEPPVILLCCFQYSIFSGQKGSRFVNKTKCR